MTIDELKKLRGIDLYYHAGANINESLDTALLKVILYIFENLDHTVVSSYL